MPTLYVDKPLLDIVRERKKKLEREAQKDGNEVYVPEVEALETMFSDEAMRAVEREREQHGN